MSSKPKASSFDTIIPPEIKNDEFYISLKNIAQLEDIETVLEIGSSSGEGSTKALVEGLCKNANQPFLFCMEMSKPRFTELQKRYSSLDFVKCYNASSISLDKYPTEDEVVEFYRNTSTKLNNYPLDVVLSWFKDGVEYLKASNVEVNGIQKIKEENNIKTFDAVLIDGNQFTGKVELDEVYGAKFIMLDDISSFKNYHNYQRLLSDPNYELVKQNIDLRLGYAIFRKKNTQIPLSITERGEQILINRLIQPGMTVFDLGANIGSYTILFSKLVKKQGHVYAFEPSSRTCEKLERRLNEFECLHNTTVIQKAVFSTNREIEFHEFPEEYSTWNSIGQPQMQSPKKEGEYVPIEKIENLETVTLDSFCSERDIHKIDYLKVDVEGAESDVLLGATDLLEKQAIQFIQFEISKNMLDGLNREARETFAILEKNGYECHRISSNGEIATQVHNSNSFYENYIAFPSTSLPIHFFTIVLNGEPFIRYHIDLFKKLPFKWHWHIIEGVAAQTHDTSWCLKNGGQITSRLHQNGLSRDGTTEYLNELAPSYPENITVYRKKDGEFWDGKLEMVNAPLKHIDEDCLLWQIDVDELWTVEQICAARNLFISYPQKTSAFYWCWYFVGADLIISSRNCYAQNPHQEWLRTWRFKPGLRWISHSPPVLADQISTDRYKNVATINPFTHEETEAHQLVFQHFAYATEEQLAFKETYYGYDNAVAHWQALQQQSQFPVRLRQFFPWVGDLTTVDRAENFGIKPIAQFEKGGDTLTGRFLSPELLQGELHAKPEISQTEISPIIAVDAVFFQLHQTGIARVWKNVLQEWSASGFIKHVVILDRAGTAPDVLGAHYFVIPAYNPNAHDADRTIVQQACDAVGADVFISTYFTTPLTTPSALMVYDMIPEWDVEAGKMRPAIYDQKQEAIKYASAHTSTYITISENTKIDLCRFSPTVEPSQVTVAHCGVGAHFTTIDTDVINQFKHKYGITKPYFLVIAIDHPIQSYKNNGLFLKAFAQLPGKGGIDIVGTGFSTELTDEVWSYTAGSTLHLLRLSDQELAVAYAGAIALIFPSKYEGFGLPVLEAMASGCPVITTPVASIPEVGGDAVLYVDPDDVDGLAAALCEVQKPSVRRSMIAKGLERASQFSWAQMADTTAQALVESTLSDLNLREINIIAFPDWHLSVEELYESLEASLLEFLNHLNCSSMTLLISANNAPEDSEPEMLLAEVVMTILMQADLEFEEEPSISLVGELSPTQWRVLARRLMGYVELEQQDEEGVKAIATTYQIPAMTLLSDNRTS